jgi:hypothetical protein
VVEKEEEEKQQEDEEHLAVFIKAHRTTSMLYYGGYCTCVVPKCPSETISMICNSEQVRLK